VSAPERAFEIVRTENETEPTRAWRTLAWTSLAVFMAILDGTVLFVAFPSIGRSFPTVSAADLSWILNAYTIVYGALLVPAGRIADRLGRRRVFLSGVALFALASLAAGLAPSPAFIIAARILQAIGGAMLTPSSLALVLAAFPRSKRSVAVSLWAAVGALAAAVGPSAGSGIIQLGGWRWAFFVNLPFALIALARGRHVLEESQAPNAEGVPDAVGIVQLVAGMALVALGVVRAREWGANRALACIVLGVALLVIFVRRSSRVASPALDLALFEVRSFRYANLATLVYGATFSTMFLGSVLFLTNVWGYSTFQAGLGITPGPLVVMAVAPLAGRVAARRGHRFLLLPGGILFALAFLVRYLSTSPTPHYVTEWLPPMIASGVGVGLILPSLAGAAAHSLPAHRLAVGSGVNQAVRQIGGVLGVGIVIGLVGRAHGTEALPTFQVIFFLLVLGGLATAAISAGIDTRPRPS
jgi:EmrB/QacA subfamily drug resistance transporter